MDATRATPHDVVFLFDCDNTLLDNDHVLADLRAHMVRESQADRAYGKFSRICGASLATPITWGRCSGIGRSIRRDTRLLLMSSFLIDYPFANGLSRGARCDPASVGAWAYC